MIDYMTSVERMMIEAYESTEPIKGYHETAMLAMTNVTDPNLPVKAEKWIKMSLPGSAMEIPAVTQSCNGHRFQYHVPVVLQVGENQSTGTLQTVYKDGQKYVRINCLIDSGASVTLISEALVENMKLMVVEKGNLTLTTIHDTKSCVSHFYILIVKLQVKAEKWKTGKWYMRPRSLPD